MSLKRCPGLPTPAGAGGRPIQPEALPLVFNSGFGGSVGSRQTAPSHRVPLGALGEGKRLGLVGLDGTVKPLAVEVIDLGEEYAQSRPISTRTPIVALRTPAHACGGAGAGSADCRIFPLAVHERSVTLFFLLLSVVARFLRVLLPWSGGRPRSPSGRWWICRLAGTTPEVLQNQVVDRLEKQIQEVAYTDTIETTIRPGQAALVIRFQDSTPSEKVPDLYQVRSACR